MLLHMYVIFTSRYCFLSKCAQYDPSCRRALKHYSYIHTYSSKLKEFADDNFKFDENGRKLSKQVENTVGKGEIACYEQLLFFLQCFQKACFPTASKGVIVWEWVKLEIVRYGKKTQYCLVEAEKDFNKMFQTSCFHSMSPYTPAKQTFSGVYWNQHVCPSVCLSFYKILISFKALWGY